MPVTPAAKELRDALIAGAAARALADALMLEIAPATEGVLDTGANEYLVVLPGYGPLTPDVNAYFKVLPELN